MIIEPEKIRHGNFSTKIIPEIGKSGKSGISGKIGFLGPDPVFDKFDIFWIIFVFVINDVMEICFIYFIELELSNVSKLCFANKELCSLLIKLTWYTIKSISTLDLRRDVSSEMWYQVYKFISILLGSTLNGDLYIGSSVWEVYRRNMSPQGLRTMF